MECSLELLDRKLLVALQDLGAAGLTSSSAEMAAKGEVGLELDVRLVPLRERDMEPFEIMLSESQERMLCVVEPERLEEVLAVCARWEVNATAIGKVTATRRLRVFDGEELVGDLPVTALVDECPPYDLEPAEPATPIYPAPPAVLSTRRPGRDPARPAGRPQPRVAHGRSSSTTGRRLPHGPPHRAAPTRRSCCSCAQRRSRRRGTARGPRSRSRSTATAAASPRTLRGAVEAVARVLGEPRLRRRRAARAHELPELRQPGEAAHRVAAHARGRGPGRRLPRVRHPGRGRQRLALQRGRRGPDLPDAGRRPGRRAAGRASAPAASASRPRATRSRWSPRAGRRRSPPPSCPSCAARPSRAAARASSSASSRPCTPRSARPCAPARCTPRTTSPRAASPSRWPSPRCRRARRDRLGLERPVRRGSGRVRRLRPGRGPDRVRRRRPRDRRGRRGHA